MEKVLSEASNGEMLNHGCGSFETLSAAHNACITSFSHITSSCISFFLLVSSPQSTFQDKISHECEVTSVSMKCVVQEVTFL